MFARAGAGLWQTDWRRYSRPALLCGYLGLTLATVAWWWAGRAIRSAGAVDPRRLVTTLGAWSLPLPG